VCILIGGSGSTGSSLLRRVLSRHPEIYSGPELSFFNKEQLFEDWNKYKNRILYPSIFLPTRGWFPYEGTRLIGRESNWNKRELTELVKNSNNISDFTNDYFNKCLKDYNKKFWIEKTPSNSLGFKYFLEIFKKGKIVHLVRDPYDTVASFSNRGFSPIIGAGMYIYNNAMALRCSDDRRYYLMKYENLVINPEQEFKKLFDFLGLEFNKEILFPTQKEDDGINEWGNQPNQQISKSAVNRFRKITKNLQDEIISALSVFEINKKYVEQKRLNQKNCHDLCKELKYDYIEVQKTKYKTKIAMEYSFYYLKKCIKLNPTVFNYPGKLILANK
jgi:sulfotransferase family protein